jgi:hypothetical protein
MNKKILSAEKRDSAQSSIPNVTLVKINSMLAQQLAVFLLKRAIAVVFSLAVYILQHRNRAGSGSPKMRRIRAARKSREIEGQAL